MYATLLAAILKFIRSVRGKHTIDDIVEDFRAKYNKLHLAASVHEAEVKIHDEAIELATKAKAFAAAEQARAKALAAKLGDLF